jgi:predicted HTH transcriptional regulator
VQNARIEHSRICRPASLRLDEASSVPVPDLIPVPVPDLIPDLISLERKTENDLKDLLKTMVAFANSVRPEETATILIGGQDDGTVQGVKSPDSILRSVRKTAEQIYPAIHYRADPYQKDGKYCC